MNPCDGNMCSDLCLLSSNSSNNYVCACPDGAELNANGMECNCEHIHKLCVITHYIVDMPLMFFSLLLYTIQTFRLHNCLSIVATGVTPPPTDAGKLK